MPLVDKHNIANPNESRPFVAHGHLDVVQVGDFTIGQGVFEPGWRWSVDVKPIAGTQSCMARHTGVCLSGSMTIRGDDGSEITLEAGDVMLVEPGHDAWVVGDEPCILLDTAVAVSSYAKSA